MHLEIVPIKEKALARLVHRDRVKDGWVTSVNVQRHGGDEAGDGGYGDDGGGVKLNPVLREGDLRLPLHTKSCSSICQMRAGEVSMGQSFSSGQVRIISPLT